MSAPVPASATAFLANIPSPDQGVWSIGPIPIRAYAFCIVAGIIVAILWSDRRWVARGGRKGTVTDVALFAVPFGLVGGRLYHVATDWHKYFGPDRNPVDALKIWEGGLGIWGAVALGALGAWIGCRRRGVPLPAFADAVAPGLVLAQAIGRLGNWFNQELYGGPTDLPWGLELYRRIDPESGLADPITGVAMDHAPVAVVHPTFLYELLWNVGVALLVVWADRRFRLGHGRAFALYVAGYTAGRVWIEMMRTDDATLLLGIRINVFTSLILLALAVLYLVLVRGEREDPASLRGRPLPGDDDYPEPGSGEGRAPATDAATDAAGSADAETPTKSASERRGDGGASRGSGEGGDGRGSGGGSGSGDGRGSGDGGGRGSGGESREGGGPSAESASRDASRQASGEGHGSGDGGGESRESGGGSSGEGDGSRGSGEKSSAASGSGSDRSE